jgi:hypothetical protein
MKNFTFKLKFWLFSAILLFPICFTHAQVTKEWDKRFGGSSNHGEWLKEGKVIQTSDGGYLLGGSTGNGASGDVSQSSRGLRDYWVAKISSSGTKQWDRRFGGYSYDELTSIIQTPDGGFLLGGLLGPGLGETRRKAAGVAVTIGW